MEYIEIENKKVIVKGIGKLFYESGFPISMSVNLLKEKGYEVSLLHIIDECLKNGWSKETILKKTREDFADIGEKVNLDQVSKFCDSEYEEQREMIFQYLFGKSSEFFINNPKEINTWQKNRVKKKKE